MKLRIGIAALTAAAVLAGPVQAQELNATEKKNLEIVLAQSAAMGDRDVARAASYIADDYIQHNPRGPSGKKAWIELFTRLWGGAASDSVTPAHRETPVITVTQGDLVTLIFMRLKPEPADPAKTYESFWFDTYRVTDGLITEHWDPEVKPPVAAAPAK